MRSPKYSTGTKVVAGFLCFLMKTGCYDGWGVSVSHLRSLMPSLVYIVRMGRFSARKAAAERQVVAHMRKEGGGVRCLVLSVGYTTPPHRTLEKTSSGYEIWRMDRPITIVIFCQACTHHFTNKLRKAAKAQHSTNFAKRDALLRSHLRHGGNTMF